MMLTSVSSISTTIESNSDRAAENFMALVPHDKVDSLETRREGSRLVQLSAYRRSIAREKVPRERSRSLRRIFPLQRKRPQRSRERPVVCGRSTHRRVRKVGWLAIRLATRRWDELRTTRPIRSIVPVNPARTKQLPPTGQKHLKLWRRSAAQDEVCQLFQTDSTQAMTHRQIAGRQL